VSDEELKTYRVYRHYHYAEIYYVDAESEEQAISKLDYGFIHGEFDEPDDIFQEFDFYNVYEEPNLKDKK